MTITPSEAPHAIRLTVASRGGTPAGIAAAMGTPSVGSPIADHPLPAIGTTYEAPPPHSVDLYA